MPNERENHVRNNWCGWAEHNCNRGLLLYVWIEVWQSTDGRNELSKDSGM